MKKFLLSASDEEVNFNNPLVTVIYHVRHVWIWSGSSGNRFIIGPK